MIIATCEVLLFGLLFAGAIQDLLSFRLANWLTLTTAAFGFLWVLLMASSLTGILLHVAAGLVMLAGGLLAFRFNMLGGGDVKWLAAQALWIGLNVDLMRFVILTTFVGGVLALVVLLLTRLKPDYGLQGGKRHLPYGVAIAAAGLDFWFRRGQLGQDLMALANP